MRESPLPAYGILKFILLFSELEPLSVKQTRLVILSMSILVKFRFVFKFELLKFSLNLSNLMSEKVAHSENFGDIVMNKL